MDEKEQALKFNRQLDRLLAGKAQDTTLSPLDQQALELARRLSLANFSSESSVRDSLRLRLLKLSTIEAKPHNVGLLQLNFSTWAMAALVLMILLIHTIGIYDPLPAFVASNLPAPGEVTILSTDLSRPSALTTAQALQPIPIPTPQAISAVTHLQNQTSLAPYSRTQPWPMYSDQTRTPIPDLQPRPGARP